MPDQAYNLDNHVESLNMLKGISLKGSSNQIFFLEENSECRDASFLTLLYIVEHHGW